MASLNTSNTQTDSNGKSRTRIEAHNIVSIVSLRHPSQGTIEGAYIWIQNYISIYKQRYSYVYIHRSIGTCLGPMVGERTL